MRNNCQVGVNSFRQFFIQLYINLVIHIFHEAKVRKENEKQNQKEKQNENEKGKESENENEDGNGKQKEDRMGRMFGNPLVLLKKRCILHPEMIDYSLILPHERKTVPAIDADADHGYQHDHLGNQLAIQ